MKDCFLIILFTLFFVQHGYGESPNFYEGLYTSYAVGVNSTYFSTTQFKINNKKTNADEKLAFEPLLYFNIGYDRAFNNTFHLGADVFGQYHLPVKTQQKFLQQQVEYSSAPFRYGIEFTTGYTFAKFNTLNLVLGLVNHKMTYTAMVLSHKTTKTDDLFSPEFGLRYIYNLAPDCFLFTNLIVQHNGQQTLTSGANSVSTGNVFSSSIMIGIAVEH